MAYQISRTLGAAGASSSTSSLAAVDTAAAKITAFAKTAKDEAERAFSKTILGSDADRAKTDDIIVSTAQVASALKVKVANVPAFVKDPATAKSAIDNAMAKASLVLPQIKDIGNVAKVQDAANAAKSAIDAAAAAVAAEAAASRARSAAASSFTPPTSAAPPPSFGPPAEAPKIPWALVAGAVGLALVLIPSKGK